MRINENPFLGEPTVKESKLDWRLDNLLGYTTTTQSDTGVCKFEDVVRDLEKVIQKNPTQFKPRYYFMSLECPCDACQAEGWSEEVWLGFKASDGGLHFRVVRYTDAGQVHTYTHSDLKLRVGDTYPEYLDYFLAMHMEIYKQSRNEGLI